MASVADGFDGEFAVPGGNRDEFATGEFFRRGAFVDVNMSRFATDHCVIGIGQRFQAEAIGCRAIESKEHFAIGLKQIPESIGGSRCPRVVSVCQRVAAVGHCHGGPRLGANSGIVVAGELLSEVFGVGIDQ